MNLLQIRSDIFNSIQLNANKFYSTVSQLPQKYHSLSFNAKLLIGATAAGTLALAGFAAHQYLYAPVMSTPGIQDPSFPSPSINTAGNTASGLNGNHSVTSLKDQIDSLHLNTNLRLTDGIAFTKLTILPVDNGMCPANHSQVAPVPLFFKEISTAPYNTAPKHENSLKLPKPDIIPVSNGTKPQALTCGLYDNSTISVISKVPVLPAPSPNVVEKFVGQHATQDPILAPTCNDFHGGVHINGPQKDELCVFHANSILSVIGNNSKISVIGNLPVSCMDAYKSSIDDSIKKTRLKDLFTEIRHELEIKTNSEFCSTTKNRVWDALLKEYQETRISEYCLNILDGDVKIAKFCTEDFLRRSSIKIGCTNISQNDVLLHIIPFKKEEWIPKITDALRSAALRNLFEKQAEADKYEAVTKEQLADLLGKERDLSAEEGRRLYNLIAKLNLEFGIQALKNPQISDDEAANAACQTRHNTKVYIRSRLSECMQQASEHIDWIRHKNITGLSCDKIMKLYKNNATKIIEQAGSPNTDVNFIAENLSEDKFCMMPAFLRNGLASTAIKPLVLSKAIQKGDVKGAINIITPEAVSDVVPPAIYTTAAFTAYKVLSFGVRGLGRCFNHFRAMP